MTVKIKVKVLVQVIIRLLLKSCTYVWTQPNGNNKEGWSCVWGKVNKQHPQRKNSGQ